MRRTAALLVAAAMLAAPVVTSSSAQAHCTSATDESAFDVAALKSELSVLAVQCGDDTDYNGFVERDRSELVHQDGVVNAWFKRNYGRAAQAKYDSYITLQANEQSLSGQHEGSEFCPRWKQVFAEVSAVPVASLAQYAAVKNLYPVDVACVSINESTASVAPKGRPTSRRSPAKK